MLPIPFRFRLADDWRHPLRFASLHLTGTMALIFGVGPILAQTWREIPDEWKALLPNGWAHWIATGSFVLIAVGHFFQLERITQDGQAQDSQHDAQ